MWAAGSNAVGGWAEHFEQLGAYVAALFFHDANTHLLAGQGIWDEYGQAGARVPVWQAAHTIPAVGEGGERDFEGFWGSHCGDDCTISVSLFAAQPLRPFCERNQQVFHETTRGFIYIQLFFFTELLAQGPQGRLFFGGQHTHFNRDRPGLLGENLGNQFFAGMRE